MFQSLTLILNWYIIQLITFPLILIKQESTLVWLKFYVINAKLKESLAKHWFKILNSCTISTGITFLVSGVVTHKQSSVLNYQSDINVIKFQISKKELSIRFIWLVKFITCYWFNIFHPIQFRLYDMHMKNCTFWKIDLGSRKWD